jgi:hypothetical protein
MAFISRKGLRRVGGYIQCKAFPVTGLYYLLYYCSIVRNRRRSTVHRYATECLYFACLTFQQDACTTSGMMALVSPELTSLHQSRFCHMICEHQLFDQISSSDEPVN